MAIIIEEEKPRSNLSNTVGIGVMVIVVATAAYYIFFAPATPAIVTPPASFGDITPITQLSLQPSSVTNNPEFQSLKEDVPQPLATGPTPLGRTNPFIAP
jgi:hypothetical protein